MNRYCFSDFNEKDNVKKKERNLPEQISAKELFSVMEDFLTEGRHTSFIVTGMSMWPFLCHGRDQVVIEKCPPDFLRRGDIVLVQTNMGNYILHRITKISECGFETTGDGNYFRDGFFAFSCLRGRVVRMVRKGTVINCNNRLYRMLARAWMFFFPIRKWITLFWFCIRKEVKH